jgi:hypothetical protein
VQETASEAATTNTAATTGRRGTRRSANPSGDAVTSSSLDGLR